MIDIYSKIKEIQDKGQDAVLVTVTSKEGMGPADVGKKMLVTQKESYGTVGGGSIEHYAINKCKDIFKSRQSLSESYVLNDKDVLIDKGEVKLNMACGGKATLFYEFIGPKQIVYIFGGGHCGASLSSLLVSLGFYVIVIDNREDVLEKLDPKVNKKILSGFGEYVIKANHELDNHYIVVSTPNHIEDFDVLDNIINLKLSPIYFGMLCSKKKVQDYLEKIYSKYSKDINLDNFYSPIGLDTGGDSPEEVALSIAGEILSVFYNKIDLNSHMRNNVPESVRYFKKDSKK